MENSRNQICNKITSPAIRQDAISWDKWVTQSQARINLNRYTLRAKESIARRDAEVAFGRVLALKNVVKKTS